MRDDLARFSYQNGISHGELQNLKGHEQLMWGKKAESLVVLPNEKVQGFQVSRYVQGP